MANHSLSSGFKLTCAVFADSAAQSVLVCLDDDITERGAADAVAQGYAFAGIISIVDAVPHVEFQPGHQAAVMMAGLRFVELLGPRLKQHQLAVQAAIEGGI